MVQEGGLKAPIKFTFELLAGVRELNSEVTKIFERYDTSCDFYRFPFIKKKNYILIPNFIWFQSLGPTFICIFNDEGSFGFLLKTKFFLA